MKTSFKKVTKFSKKSVLGILHLTHNGYLSGGILSEGFLAQGVFVLGSMSRVFCPGGGLCPDTFCLSLPVDHKLILNSDSLVPFTLARINSSDFK